MNHDHEHTHHNHSHEHEKGEKAHTHDHEHTHDQSCNKDELTFDGKLAILIGHWIDHNKSHQQTYESWADKAVGEDQPKTAALLKEVSEDSRRITTTLEKALQAIRH